MDTTVDHFTPLALRVRGNNNKYHFHHHQLLQTGFSEYTEVVTTSLTPIDAILPEIFTYLYF